MKKKINRERFKTHVWVLNEIGIRTRRNYKINPFQQRKQI